MRLGTIVLVLALAACGRAALLDDSKDGGGTGGGLSGGGGTAGGTAGGATAGGATAGGASAGGASAGGAAAGGNAGGGSRAGGAAGGGAADPCRGLTDSACRLNPLCTSDYCFLCTCRPRYEQCRLKTAAPFGCPPLGCAQPACCANDAACSRPDMCVDSNTVRCGICNNAPSTCSTDAQCDPATTGNICKPRDCACSGQSDCLPGCSANNPCGDGQVCNANTKRCEEVRCGTVPCAGGFTCVMSPAGAICVPRSCTTDLECGDLFCVNGLCKSTLGFCSAAIP